MDRMLPESAAVPPSEVEFKKRVLPQSLEEFEADCPQATRIDTHIVSVPPHMLRLRSPTTWRPELAKEDVLIRHIKKQPDYLELASETATLRDGEILEIVLYARPVKSADGDGHNKEGTSSDAVQSVRFAVSNDLDFSQMYLQTTSHADGKETISTHSPKSMGQGGSHEHDGDSACKRCLSAAVIGIEQFGSATGRALIVMVSGSDR
jgi:hypothetical protein